MELYIEEVRVMQRFFHYFPCVDQRAYAAFQREMAEEAVPVSNRRKKRKKELLVEHLIISATR